MNILTIDDIRSVAGSLKHRYGISEVILFGSFTKGNLRESSDIDVVVKPTTEMRGRQVFEFGEELSGLLGRRVDAFGTFEILPGSSVASPIERDGVLL